MRNVRDAAIGHWIEILTKLGADGSLLDGKHRPCPACGGDDRFRFDDKEGRGTHICSQCGAGDGFELVMKMFNYSSFKDAAKAVEDVLGIEGKPPSEDEQRAYRKRLADERTKREKQEAEAHRIAAIEAKRICGASPPVSTEHAYLQHKKVKVYGIQLDGKDLIIPVCINGEIVSFQRIGPDGKKLFLKGGEIRGGFHSIAGDERAGTGRIIIVEGYATGATIREATGDHVAVAFNAGNLARVAETIRAKHPDVEIIIAGDNDESQTGETKGKAAADMVGGSFIMPEFADGETGSDWNDYAATHGLSAVADAFQIIPESEQVSESMGDTIDRLAKLTPLEYDKVRQAEAKVLGVRAATLDASVIAARKEAQEHKGMFEAIEPWPEIVNGGELLAEIVAAFNKYIVTPQYAPESAALWVLNTYVHDASYHSPMLLITSPEKRCGKSTMLSLLYAMSNNALLAANISPAAVYRAIEQWKPTLLIDEADTFLKQNDDMAGVINSGHTKTTAFVMRCDGDANEVKAFSTWCPKVIAGIGSQRDTLEDRSICILLRRKLEGEQVARLRLDRNNFDDIKRKCARWAADNYQTVFTSDPLTPKGLHDREADNWTPLLAIADLCDWREKTEIAALALSGSDESESIDTILLSDIRDIFKTQGTDRLASQRLCDLLAAIDDRPWAEWSKGRAISTNKLAGRLKSFGIHSKTMRLPKDEMLKGYELQSFADAFSRYCDSKRNNVTTVAAPQKTDISKRNKTENVTEQKTLEPLQDNDCYVVTLPNAEVGGSAASARVMDVF
jgi:putative DNA primase/helicase